VDQTLVRHEGIGLRLVLQRSPQAPSQARAAVRAFSEESELASEFGTLSLLVSELVSNAVLHSDASPSSDVVLHAQVLERGGVRVEVIDRGSAFDVAPLAPTGGRCGGWGLYLVDEQASNWGVDREEGTRVWFELRD
jgi:anti-sigma regulatory factor (Ser/Thr protein kinase)